MICSVAVAMGLSACGNHSADTRETASDSTTADTVHASASVGVKPAGATATVYWTCQDGVSPKQENQKMSGNSVAFAFGKAVGIKAGKYNVDIDVNDIPVGIADYSVE